MSTEASSKGLRDGSKAEGEAHTAQIILALRSSAKYRFLVERPRGRYRERCAAEEGSCGAKEGGGVSRSVAKSAPSTLRSVVLPCVAALSERQRSRPSESPTNKQAIIFRAVWRQPRGGGLPPPKPCRGL